MKIFICLTFLVSAYFAATDNLTDERNGSGLHSMNQDGLLPKKRLEWHKTAYKLIDNDAVSELTRGNPTDDSAMSGAVDDSAMSGAVDDSAMSGAVDDSAMSGAVDDSAMSGAVDDSAMSGAVDDSALSGAVDDSAMSGAVETDASPVEPDDVEEYEVRELTKPKSQGSLMTKFWGRRRRRRRRHSRRRSRSHRTKNPCTCENNGCTCCKKVLLFKACIEVTYEENEFEVSITAAGSTLLSKTIPVNDAEPLCGSVMGTEVCAEIYDTSVDETGIHACIKLSEPIEFNIHCVHIRPGKAEVTYTTLNDPNDEGNAKALTGDVYDDKGADVEIVFDHLD